MQPSLPAAPALLALIACGCAGRQAVEADREPLLTYAKEAAPALLNVAGTALSIEFVPIPGGTLEARVPGTDSPRHELAPCWMSRTEIPWELYDAFVFGLDQPQAGAAASGADGLARPSKPYITVDRGFGHAGWPAISMSAQGAEAFCAWLAERSGRRVRLPSAAELAWAARAGAAHVDPTRLAAEAWFAANADGKTHAVGTRDANAFGLFDVLGNAAEWCRAADGSVHVSGGSYRDPAEALDGATFVAPLPAWNASDPQVPKSAWWLADAPFVGFRVVLDDAF